MKYIVAVSGGVDSVVLLHMLKNNKLDNFSAKDEFIVAHFDHGIRAESADDAKFVEKLAKGYGLEYMFERAELGSHPSEDRARKARYNFLRQCSKKFEASAIILAHHQDDIIETALLNLIRGTGWRGLCSLRSTESLHRPLLHFTKDNIKDYAQQHNLQWVEDATNFDQFYLRNYIRHTLLPKAKRTDSDLSQKLTTHIQKAHELRVHIEEELSTLLGQISQSDNYRFEVSRYEMIMLPVEVLHEIIYLLLVKLDPDWHPSALHIRRVAHFVKTGKPRKSLIISNGMLVMSKKHSLEFQKY